MASTSGPVETTDELDETTETDTRGFTLAEYMARILHEELIWASLVGYVDIERY